MIQSLSLSLSSTYLSIIYRLILSLLASSLVVLDFRNHSSFTFTCQNAVECANLFEIFQVVIDNFLKTDGQPLITKKCEVPCSLLLLLCHLHRYLYRYDEYRFDPSIMNRLYLSLSLSLTHDFVGGVFVVVVLLLVRAVVQTQDLPAQMHRVAKEHQEEKEGPLHQESRLQDQQQRRFRSKPVIYDRITNPVL